MVDMAQAAGIKVILLAPTVIQEDPKSEGNKRLVMYVAAEKKIAAEKKCQFVDLHEYFLAALKQEAGRQRRLAHPRRRSHEAAGRRDHGRRCAAGVGVPDAKLDGAAAASK